MLEENLRPLEKNGAPGGLAALWEGDDTDGASVRVISGLMVEQLPLANRTVGEVRRRFHQRMNIDPHSQAVLDGRPVGDNEVIRPGAILSFIRRAGEKG